MALQYVVLSLKFDKQDSILNLFMQLPADLCLSSKSQEKQNI